MNKDFLAYVRTKLGGDYSTIKVGNNNVNTPRTDELMELYYTALESPTNDDLEINLEAIKNMSPVAHDCLHK